jgi:hypothetical protein
MCRWFANRAEVLTSHVRQKNVVFHMNLFDISSRPTKQHLISAQAGEQQLNHLDKTSPNVHRCHGFPNLCLYHLFGLLIVGKIKRGIGILCIFYILRERADDGRWRVSSPPLPHSTAAQTPENWREKWRFSPYIITPPVTLSLSLLHITTSGSI